MELTVPAVFLPGPRPEPILGWRGAMIPFGADPLGYVIGVYRRYGALAAISRSDPVMLFAFGPEHNKVLLTDAARFETDLTGNAPFAADSAAARISNGLLAMNGDRHRQQRRLMLPSFHRQQVNGYRDAMVEQIEHVLDRWRPGEHRDMAHEMQELTLGVALKTLFSLDTTPEALTLGELFKQSLEISFAPLELALPLELPGTGRYRLLRLAERIEAHVRTLIAQRRALGDGSQDVLATLIAARDEEGQALTDDELIGQTYTLFAAGHETSSNALTWALFLLDQHPELLADLHDELWGELRGEAPSLEQLGRLPLLDRVVKEVLRLMPPASVLMRRSTAPFELGGFALPAGATIFLSPFITQRMPEHWEAPFAFMPARWERIDPSPYTYLPFGAGPRMCIGTSFALMEIKLALAAIVQRFRVALPAETRVDPELRLTLRPRGGMPMRIERQDRAFRRVPVSGDIHRIVDLMPARAAAAGSDNTGKIT
jgi:cytochrome P450